MADNPPVPAPAPAPAPAGFRGAFDFFDGVAGIAGRVGGIVDTAANAAEDVARGKSAIANQRQDKRDRQLTTALRLKSFDRGDNKIQIFAVAAAAVAVIVLMR